MWIPTTVEELEGSVQRGEVAESATLDFKREIPSKNKETAKDLAAMANDGGVLIYGVGEDSQGRPTQLAPLTLKGQAERLTQIAQSALSPPLEITPKSLRREGAEGQGYLVVVVPASPSAPHQVTVEGDCRFYGRNAAGNQILTEGDVSRLYERRKRWDVDTEKLLDEVIAKAGKDFPTDGNCLFMFARPTTATEGLLARAGDRAQQRESIRTWVMTAHVAAGRKGWLPNTNPESSASGWTVTQDTGDVRRLLATEFDGLVRFSQTPIAWQDERRRFLASSDLEEEIRFLLAFVRAACTTISIVTAIDVGLALTGMRSVRIVRRDPHHRDDIALAHHRKGFAEPIYRQTVRTSSLELDSSPQKIACDLLYRLAHAFDRDVSDLVVEQGWAPEGALR